MRDRGLWDMTPQEILQHGYDSTIDKLKNEGSEKKLCEAWKANQAALDKHQRGTNDYTMCLGIRKALKEIGKKAGIGDFDARIEWLARYGKKG